MSRYILQVVILHEQKSNLEFTHSILFHQILIYNVRK